MLVFSFTWIQSFIRNHPHIPTSFLFPLPLPPAPLVPKLQSPLLGHYISNKYFMFQNWFIFLEHENTYACPSCSGHTPCWGRWGVLLLTRGTRATRGLRGLRRGGARGLKGGARIQGATARARGNGRTRTSGTGSQTRAEVKG